jgi:hypothetical protein
MTRPTSCPALHCRPRRPARAVMPTLPMKPVWRVPKCLQLPLDPERTPIDHAARARHLERLLASLPGMMRKEPSP